MFAEDEGCTHFCEILYVAYITVLELKEMHIMRQQKCILSLHSCKTVVGDSQNNIRNILNAIIGAI